MKIGYARVSTVGQDLATQEEMLKKAGCKKVFVEKITGASKIHREKLLEAIEFMDAGDTLVVTKIDRLARSIIDLNNLVQDLNAKEISVQFIKDNMEFMAGEDSNSIQTLLFNILGSFAQFERDLIVERTTEGRERAKQQGKHMGRPSQPQKNVERALELYKQRGTNGMSVNDIAKLTSVPRSTIYAEIKK
ncbi:resolvase [Salipaludibacillus neizhouensis]|uniref:Resolvase n=1 Tax=Salipaludibacillus neizhouensis TaxID=885475 RepID=A0A3A9K222_9BACI|nr:recombinase family protein [Salipaludibacillus neizhouensis]RKL64970.1 resolvase [Salipaludibacillus neizhouensis]